MQGTPTPNMKLILQSLALVILLHFSGSPLAVPPAFAAEELRIGLSARSAPYVLDPSLQRGIEPELLSLIVARMGYEAAFFSVPFKRHAQVMNAHKLDALSLWTVPNDLKCHLSKPYRFWRNALFTEKSTTRNPQKPAPSDAKRIGIFEGSENLKDELDKLGLAHSNLWQTTSIEEAVRMLQYGRLDGHIGDYPTALYILKQQAANGPSFQPVHFFKPVPQQLCFLDPDLARAFDQALAQIKAEDGDALASIPRRHGITERITPPLEQLNKAQGQ